MKGADARSVTIGWLALLAITAVSFGSVEFVEPRQVAIVLVGVVVVSKVTIILRRFMSLAGAPTGIRLYLSVWSIVCGGIITTLWLAAPSTSG